MKFEYRRPMKAIALDPEYSRKTSRRIVAGGLSGNLILNMKKWLGYRDQVSDWTKIKWKGKNHELYFCDMNLSRVVIVLLLSGFTFW